MENLVSDLDTIITKLQLLKTDRQQLRSKNKQLEVQLNHLKVEIDQYKTKYINLKKEKEELEGKVNHSLSSKSDDSSIGQEQSAKKVESLKLQLDEFIEDIDQCIQIIQAK
jgi:phage shock protein A